MKVRVGGQYRKVVCDVCGGEFRQKDVSIVQDRWNFQNSLVVCHKDADKLNEQVKPIIVKEKVVDNYKLIRPLMPVQYVAVDTDNRLPGAPSNIRFMVNSLTGYLMVMWDAPIDGGSSGIVGYTVRRATPQLGYYDVISADTGNNNTVYEDSTADLATFYTYIVAAINSFGMGPYSDPGYYPTKQVESDFNYLSISQEDSILTTSSGVAIIL